MRRTVAAVPEEVVRLEINREPLATWTCSPSALEALGAGRLLTAGFLRHRTELRELRVRRARGGHVIEADVAPEAAARGFDDWRHRREHGCGLTFLLDCRPDRIPARHATAPVPEPAEFHELFRELFGRSPSRKDAGGHHTAALVAESGLEAVHEEVGRHNGVDKVLGHALLAGAAREDRGLLTTARISGEIAEKAVLAGVAWVASRSVPTTLAVALAAAAGLPLVGRAASPEARVFAGEDDSA
jgi:FdhD protein